MTISSSVRRNAEALFKTTGPRQKVSTGFSLMDAEAKRIQEKNARLREQRLSKERIPAAAAGLPADA